MKIKVLDVKIGDRIVAYCNNKMQICKVKSISNNENANITLSVFTSQHYRSCLVSSVVRFRDDALVDLVSERNLN